MNPKDINSIVEDNLGLVHYVIDKNFNSAIANDNAIDREDLFQEGAMALRKAAENYDESKGFKFSTFACTVINNSLRHYLKKFSKVEDNLCLSLDQEFNDDNNGSLIDTLEGFNYIGQYIDKEALDEYKKYFEDILKNEKCIKQRDIDYLFGVINGETPKEIAECYNTDTKEVNKRLYCIRRVLKHSHMKEINTILQAA